MRVVEVTRFGGPEVLVSTEAADPVAAPGQVVVDVSAADVLFVETRIRRGGGGRYFDVTPPYVPGGGVAGRVRSVGEGVDPGWVGRPVVTSTAERGGYAEQVAVPSEGLIPVPDGVDLREAAALLHDGNTAFGLLEGTGIEAGEWVLVTAAGGGLGILLVQLARVAGARGDRRRRAGRGLRQRRWADRPGRLRGDRPRRPVLRARRGQRRLRRDRPAGGGALWRHCPRDRAGPQSRARDRPAPARASASRGRGRSDQAGHRADLPAGARRRRARRDRVPRRPREDPARDLSVLSPGCWSPRRGPPGWCGQGTWALRRSRRRRRGSGGAGSSSGAPRRRFGRGCRRGGLRSARRSEFVAPTWPAGPGDQQMMMHLDIEVDPAGHPFCLWRG